MTWMVCVFATLLAGEQPDDNRLSVQLELAPATVHLGDPLFARVTIVNKMDRTVRLPNDLFLTTGYSVLPSRSPYSYRFRSEYVTGMPGSFAMPPGAKRVIDYEVLEFPPIEEWRHDFWRTNVGRHAEIVPHPWASSNDMIDLLPRMKTSFPIQVHERPPREREFLTELYGKFAARKKKRVKPKGWEKLGSSPAAFGLASVDYACPDLVRKLVAYEEDLSPGSLRDIVHLVRLTQVIYRSTDKSERQRTVDELLEWLDTLHEVERHCLAMRIISWASMMGPDEPAFYELVLGAAKRLPEQLYEFEDYRGYRLREYAGSHPPFREYREGREEFPQKETPPAGTAAPKPPDGPGGELTTNPFGEL